MDVLSDVLAAMRVGQPNAGRSRCRAPWGVRFPAGDAAACHVVLQGACWLIPDRGEPVALGVGDVVFTSHGDGHALVDRPGSPTVAFRPEHGGESPLAELVIPGDGGAATEMLCASYSFDQTRPHPLLRDLPRIIHLPARVGQHTELRAAVDLLGNELRHPRAGTEGVLPALVDMLLLYVLRAWLDERSGDTAGWATALNDPAVAVALRHIHRQPDRPWTVEELAVRAGLSRAAFAKRFATLVGQPPLTYLTWWRMTTAARMLRGTETPLRSVAERCGYGSEFAFAKAFKREYGMAPGRYRREGRSPAGAASAR
ncbi:AraC family transcriptional regulator [Streptomyces litchfieldiae]|uniref:AraC family transcriptional regulator n=1 Tax=Streptomyces litchfieldiae TaxID=3075543 RepID=A0ABU2MKF7_9ACTN|nr:AraC family transcriptional regulator [Streptomyces sp. DSM 44938]MDT0341393.1 AraC family transcriptional regulator [Streptomyces sp. DSM 44938]